MAGAVIYELKDERGYEVSLQDVADTLGLPNRESIQFYRTHEKLSKLMANEPYKKACIDFYDSTLKTHTQSSTFGLMQAGITLQSLTK